jgi:hypothetical protein
MRPQRVEVAGSSVTSRRIALRAPLFRAASNTLFLKPRQSQNRMIVSTTNISCPLRVKLSYGRALNAYSYLTSGRTEISSLNRRVFPPSPWNNSPLAHSRLRGRLRRESRNDNRWSRSLIPKLAMSDSENCFEARFDLLVANQRVENSKVLLVSHLRLEYAPKPTFNWSTWYTSPQFDS